MQYFFQQGVDRLTNSNDKMYLISVSAKHLGLIIYTCMVFFNDMRAFVLMVYVSLL